ncbi:MAG: hypothetical protein PHY44_07095 [Lachnospiraceae bacterium]|nr:hypothetical protein [Lachnospiraceae bacterium]
MKKKDERLHIEFQEGTAEEAIQLVAQQQARIGVIYFAKQQEPVLKRILETKNLQFQALKECELC